MHVLLTAITRIIQYYARIICESRADLLKATKTRKVFLPIFSPFYKINETEEFSTLIITFPHRVSMYTVESRIFFFQKVTVHKDQKSPSLAI